MARAAAQAPRVVEQAEPSGHCDRCGSALCLTLARGAAARASTLVAGRARVFADPAAFGRADAVPNVCPATGQARTITL
jgi:hypothetical protein